MYTVCKILCGQRILIKLKIELFVTNQKLLTLFEY